MQIACDFLQFNENGLRYADQVVISLGSGSGATEMSADFPVLCLDIDRKAVYSGIVNLKGNCVGKKNKTFHSYFDFRKSKDLFDIIKVLKKVLPNTTFKILFQHPNPKIKKAYSGTGVTCVECLRLGLVKEIHFVYDFRANSTCWTKQSIINHFVGENNERNLKIGEEYNISEEGNEYVIHPVFGNTVRMGWAVMKRGSEHAFAIEYGNA